MKVIAILNNTLGAGGGFDQALNAILQMQRMSSGRFDFEVFTTRPVNIAFLKAREIRATHFKITKRDRFFCKMSQNGFWLALRKRLKLISPFEAKLTRHSCDLVYFVTPNEMCSALQNLNFINTVWDLAHREHPEFPEVRKNSIFHYRDRMFHHILGPALITITDSEKLADLASTFYGVARNRFLPMPFSPSPFIADDLGTNAVPVTTKYGMEKGYFYYPAQFWSHKNHIRILQALEILGKKHNWTPTVVFSGKDYGNLAHVRKWVTDHNLSAQVKILGFVPSEDMRGLYENALAIVMPTYFGPTNLPPLEAWLTGTPLLYSAHLSGMTGDAALSFDPDRAADLASAMLKVRDSECRQQLIQAGKKRLEEIVENRKRAEEILCNVIERFASRRECWG